MYTYLNPFRYHTYLKQMLETNCLVESNTILKYLRKE